MNHLTARFQDANLFTLVFAGLLSVAFTLTLVSSLIFPPAAPLLAAITSSLGLMSLLLAFFISPTHRRSIFIGGDLFLALFLLLLFFYHSKGSSFESMFFWVFSIYGMTYGLSYIRNLNLRFHSLVIALLITALLALVMSFTPYLDFHILDFQFTRSPILPKWVPFLTQGFHPSIETFGFALSILLPFPLCVTMTHHRLSSLQKFFFHTTFSLVLIALILTFNITTWLIALTGLILLFVFMKKWKNLFLSLLILILGVALTHSYFGDHPVYEALLSQQNPFADSNREALRQGVQFFQQSPWFGVSNDFITPNAYLHLLASFGLFGFFSIMLFAVSLLFKNLRLLHDIPKSHFWHRSFSLAALIAARPVGGAPVGTCPHQ